MSKKKTAWMSDEDYEFIYRRVPRICIDLIISCDNGILLTKRAIPPYKNCWHLPGGQIRYKESIRTAIKRIFEAELGIDLPADCEPLLICPIEFPRDGKYRHSISLAYEIGIDWDLPESMSGSWQTCGVKIFHRVPKRIIPNQAAALRLYGYLS